MENFKKPELLAPAGDLEKLIIAVKYGANAVYIGGGSFGLRAKAKNFSSEQMVKGINFAHENGVRVYITANIFAHNTDFDGMAQYFKDIQSMGADAIIISDPGVFDVAIETVPNMELHISTQANNTNSRTALFWRRLGAKRIVLARELSAGEISDIRQNVPMDFELEAFVHGAMCISYSGRCLLSNYMSGRDSNKGACSHSCRWKYNLVEEKRPGEYMPVYENERGTYIYNSKDLCLIEYIPQLVEAGIGSFKIEGRMKTPYYVGAVVKAYREAIDDFFADKSYYESRKNYYLSEIQKSSHRNFTTGFYFQKPGASEQIYTTSSYIRTYDFLAIVKQYDEKTGFVLVEQRNKFIVGQEIEIFKSKGPNETTKIVQIYNEKMEAVPSAPHPQQLVYVKLEHDINNIKEHDIFRALSELC